MRSKEKIMVLEVFIIAIFAIIGTVNAATYDFSDTPLLHKAYEGYDNNISADSPPDYEVELNPDNYTAISTSDDSRANYSSGMEGKYDFHRFEFKIDEPPSGITQIYVRHEGYGYNDGGGYGLELFIWNYNNPGWQSVDYNYTSGDAIIEKTYTNGLSDYISGDGYLQLLAQTKYASTSCPYLYAWNGTAFEFVADFNGRGRLNGFGPDPLRSKDAVAIDGSQLKAADGAYRLEIAEDQQEMVYLDQVRLLVVDHPQGTEVYSPRLSEDAQPYPFEVQIIREATPPISAVDEDGNDILPPISKVDRIYAAGETVDWGTITLDFGNLSQAEQIKLVFNGYRDYAMDYAIPFDPAGKRTTVEVINEDGEWEVVYSGSMSLLGLLGRPRTQVWDISDWFKTHDYRLRLHYVREAARLDYIAVDTSPDEEVSITELNPVAADLHWKGVARAFTPDGREPGIPDYNTTVDASGFEPFAGNYTRYGDVLPLLTEVDDKFVIMAAGDDISLAFEEVPIPEGMERDYILLSDAYWKEHPEADDYFDSGQGEEFSTVEPLPFHGMSAYPYPEDESYPYDAEHIAYLEEYNTREVSASSDESDHHTIYTDYVKVFIKSPQVPSLTPIGILLLIGLIAIIAVIIIKKKHL